MRLRSLKARFSVSRSDDALNWMLKEEVSLKALHESDLKFVRSDKSVESLTSFMLGQKYSP